MGLTRLYDLVMRVWTIRSAIVAVPVTGAIVLVLVIFVGLKQAESQLGHIDGQVKSALSHQYTAMQMPVLLADARANLHRLSVLENQGGPSTEIEQTLQKLQQIKFRLRSLREAIDPRVRQMDLTERLAQLERYVQNKLPGATPDPMLDRLSAQDYEAALNATDTLLDAIAAQTRIFVVKDLNEMHNTTIELIWTFFRNLTITAAAASICAAGASRLISRPILQLAHTVESFDSGRLDVVVPATGRNDEIGKVARAVERFRASLRQNEMLMRERDDMNRNLERKVAERTSELAIEREKLAKAQEDAEHKRQRMTAKLRAEFGNVIQAASEGDFAKRVPIGFADENLQSLANDINHFVVQVDQSVNALSQAMLAMGDGAHFTDDEQTYKGAFANIMAQARETATRIQKQSNQLQHIALHDALTGLPNRRFLEDRIATFNKLFETKSLRLAVLHVDLDRFKEINDALGHAAGDKILTHTASVLLRFAEEDDFVARVGGDEFLMICLMRSNEAASAEMVRIQRLGDRIVAELSKPVVVGKQQAKTGASVGIAFSNSNTKDLSTLVGDADIALYQSKETGRNQTQVFSTSIASAITQRRTLREDLRNALDNGEFIPFFQPKVDAVTYEMTGVEALVRWEHPTRGLLTPDKFLPEADEMNIVHEIDQIVLWRSADVLNALSADDGIDIPELSVNVSQDRLNEPTLLKGLEGATGKFQLSFELLESIIFDEQGDRFHWMLDALRERDISIQIDDFGSGHASISSLLNVTPERLKIDRHLITPIVEKESNRQLVRGLVDIARAMNIKATAEGVETLEHARVAQELGCDILQGYAFAKPMSAAALRDFCQENNAGHAGQIA